MLKKIRVKVDLHSIRFCAFLRVLTQCVRRSVFLIRFLIYTVSVNAFFCKRTTKRSVNFSAISSRAEFYFCDKLRASIEKLDDWSSSIVFR